MRELDYLRNIIRKCGSAEDIFAIKLPQSFRRRGDITSPFITVIVITYYGIELEVFHKVCHSTYKIYLSDERKMEFSTLSNGDKIIIFGRDRKCDGIIDKSHLHRIIIDTSKPINQQNFSDWESSFAKKILECDMMDLLFQTKK